MAIFKNISGTMKTIFSLGKGTGRVSVRTNAGVLEGANNGEAYQPLAPITTRGDIMVGDTGAKNSRLAIGSSGQMLVSNGTDVIWEDVNTDHFPNIFMVGF